MHLRNVFLALLALAMVAYCQTPPSVLDSTYQVRYAANLNQGESYIDIINTGGNGAPALGPGFGAGSTGNICVNIYVVDPNEELLSCCSCLVTPNQTVEMPVKAGVLGNTLTGEIPTSVTIKLLGSSLTSTTGSGSCDNSAAVAGTTVNGVSSPLVPDGYVAFGTTLHQGQTAGTFVTTETAFLPVGLSAGELVSLTGRCASILGNASTFGVCAGCKAGALGAAKH